MCYRPNHPPVCPFRDNPILGFPAQTGSVASRPISRRVLFWYIIVTALLASQPTQADGLNMWPGLHSATAAGTVSSHPHGSRHGRKRHGSRVVRGESVVGANSKKAGTSVAVVGGGCFWSR